MFHEYFCVSSHLGLFEQKLPAIWFNEYDGKKNLKTKDSNFRRDLEKTSVEQFIYITNGNWLWDLQFSLPFLKDKDSPCPSLEERWAAI